MALYLLGIFMGAIDTGIITPARPIIAKDLGVNDSAGVWMLTIYTLAYAAAIPVMGKLADRRGRKQIYLVSITIFGIGSLLCGLSQDLGSFEMLIAARAIQAVGGGGILPIATAEITTEVPEEKRGMALGLVGAVFGIANIFGASAGSLILDIVGTYNWQWIFYVNVPITIAIVATGWFVLPSHAADATKPLDSVGTLLLVGIILSLLYGIKGLDFFNLGESLQSSSVWPFLAGALVALPLLVAVERRAADPILNLGYFTDRGIALTLVLSLLSGVVLMAVVFVPQLAENALRIPAGKGGYFVIVLGLASGIGAPLSGRLTDKFGPKLVLSLGFGISAIAAATVAWWMIPNPSIVSVMTSLALIGLGLGFVVGSPLNYMMLQATDAAESATALGTVSLVRSIGVTLAPAIMVGFIAHGVAELQTALTAVLPTSVQVPQLPHAKELTTRFEAWKADEKIGKELDGVAVPDLTRTTIEVDPSGGGELPADLVDLLQSADVTNITERTQIVASRMFAENSPATISDIESGIDAGIAGVENGLKSTGKARKEMADGLSDMDSKLAEMTEGMAKIDASIAEMTKGIKKMDDSLAGMTNGISKMGATIPQMTSGISKMGKALAGMDSGIAGMSKPIAGLAEAIAGMDAGLAQQKSALEKLQAAGDPALAPQIDALEKSIAETRAKRDEAASKRSKLKGERDDLLRQRAELKKQLDKLEAAKSALQSERKKLIEAKVTLTTQRAKLAAGKAALTTQRAKLAEGRKALTDARAELAAGLASLDDTRSEMKQTITQMGELRDAVPAVFDQALDDYLAEIKAQGPQLEQVFATTLGSGFKGVYLFDMAVCLLALGVIALVPKPQKT